VLGPASSSSSHGLAFAFSALSVALLIGLASALGSDDAAAVLADPEVVHALDVEQVVRLLEEAPALPVPQRLALLEALAPVVAGPAHAAAAFRRVVETLPAEALEQAHPAIRWPPYPGAGGGIWVWVTALGPVRFEEGFRDVVAIDPDG
jgi:hypothetical protein